jgi:RNA polymerase sigma-70 factor (ECF subfamily)
MTGELLSTACLAEYDTCPCCKVEALEVWRSSDLACRDDRAGLCTEAGLAAAYAAYHPTLLSRARRIVVDPHLAEEAVQEAFVRAWRNCASYDPSRGPLLTWLMVITRSVSIDLVKARTRRPPVAAAVPEQARNDDAAVLGDVDRLLLRHELTDALASIGSDHRTAIVETILRGRPYADVAAELGVPAATLRTRVHYALRRLRTFLREGDDAA